MVPRATRGFKSDTKGCTHFWWFLGPHGDLKVIQKVYTFLVVPRATRGFKSDTKGCTHFWWFLGPHGDIKVIQKGVHISGGS